MTDMQMKFLESIYENDKNAEELCKELGISSCENDELGGCYNALNNAINYLTSDDGNEIDNMFRISYIKNNPVSNKDIYIITKEGIKYVEDYRKNIKASRKSNIIGISAVIVAVIAILVTVFLHFC